MTTKANNLVINLLTAHATWSMTALFKTSQRENVLELEAISPNYYKKFAISAKMWWPKKLATVGSGRLVFINKSHHLGVFDQCCQDLWGLKRSIDGDFSQGFDGLIRGIRYFPCEVCPLDLDMAIIL